MSDADADADWNQHVEALVAAAHAGEPDISTRLDMLAPPSGDAERRRQLTARVLIALCSARHFELAREFADARGLWATSDRAGETLDARDYNTLYCLAVIDIYADGDSARALASFGHLRRSLPQGHHLQKAVADGEAVARWRLRKKDDAIRPPAAGPDITTPDAAPSMGVEVVWPSLAGPHKTVSMVCPTCAGTAPKSQVCSVSAYFPGRPIASDLLRCPDCNCLFLERLHELPYHEDTDMSGDVLAFYVQLAAGIWPITRTLTRSARPSGSRYLDVGCSFGFGLDFAIHGLAWSARGLDPGPLARRGAEQLNLPIESRYFTTADASPPVDVVMASEVLEHVATPGQFIALLRAALAPGGMLILTTPNGDAVRPDAPASVLTPVLSAGAHLVLQTAASLEWLLRDVGLTHMVVERNPTSLTVYASDRPFTLEDNEERLRATYQSYLRARMASSERGTDLWLGFAARAFQEAVIDQDAATADTAALAEELRRRYGIDLDDPTTLPAITGDMSTEQLREVAPFCIANLLYLRAVQRSHAGDQTARVGDIFLAAARIARAVRSVLATMNADDPMVATMEQDAAAQATLVAARLGSADTLERLRYALAAPDGPDQPSLRHLPDATMVALLGARAFGLAGRLKAEFSGSVGPRGRFGVWLPWLLAGCVRVAKRGLLHRQPR